MERIDSRELTEWMAYYRLEPFGADRLELMIAQLTAIVVNALRSKGTSPRKPEDFIPKFAEDSDDAEEARVQKMIFHMKQVTEVMRAKETRTKKA